MRAHWLALLVGIGIGAVAAAGMSRGMGGNIGAVTGGFAKPFQPGVRYPA